MGDLYRRCCDADFSDDSNSSSEEDSDVNKKDKRKRKGGGGGVQPVGAEISPPQKRKVGEGELHHATMTVTVTPK